MKHFAIISVMLAVGAGGQFRALTAAEERSQSSRPAVQGSAAVKNPRVAVGTAPGRRPPKMRVLDLEDAIGRAELVVAVRLVDMSESKIVHGGKMEVVTQQFRFEPVRTIKGIFARDARSCSPARTWSSTSSPKGPIGSNPAKCCFSCWDARVRATSTATSLSRSNSRSRA